MRRRYNKTASRAPNLRPTRTEPHGCGAGCATRGPPQACSRTPSTTTSPSRARPLNVRDRTLPTEGKTNAPAASCRGSLTYRRLRGPGSACAQGQAAPGIEQRDQVGHGDLAVVVEIGRAGIDRLILVRAHVDRAGGEGETRVCGGRIVDRADLTVEVQRGAAVGDGVAGVDAR